MLRHTGLSPVIWAFLFASIAGCSRGSGPHRSAPAALGRAGTTSVPEVRLANEPPIPAFRADPADLSTGVDDQTLEIIIAHWRGEASDDVTSEVQKNVKLLTWPAKAVIDFTTDRYVRRRGHPETTVKLVPAKRLDKGWYAMGVAKPLAKAQPAGRQLFDDGEMWLSRFRVGSKPFVRSVAEAAKADGNFVLYFEVSEKAILKPSAARGMALLNTLGPSDCSELEIPSDLTDRLRMFCRRSVLGEKGPGLRLGTGIAKSDGTELTSSQAGMGAAWDNGVGLKVVRAEPLTWD